ncbi:MAG: hypothetical protein B6D41_02575 [Chloroflexi bacterium UTCFX4]|jgi:hypothetical protein|nr:MAG: hypothetical protein B6D41_02575 [Chloroflexi bacterium UTCFX4]
MGREAQLIHQVAAQYKRLKEAAAACRYWYDRYVRELDAELQHQLTNADGEQHRRVQTAQHVRAQTLAQAQQNLNQVVEQRVNVALRQAQGFLGPIGAAWNAPEWKQYRPPDQQRVPGGVRCGSIDLSSTTIGAQAPVLLPLVGAKSALFVAQGSNTQIANALLSSVTLRIAATFPPGAFRFILIDPVSQGYSLRDFLRLPASLRGDKILASKQEIENALEEIGQHIENVIQTRLVNTYHIIEEYNAQTGEISVPYHFVVIANLPAGLSDSAMARLMDVARNGARTGTFLLASINPQGAFPHGYTFDMLAKLCSVVADVGGGKCRWNDSTFQGITILPDAMPPPELVNRILDQAGAAAEQRANVGLAFDRVRRAPDQFWTESSADGIAAPIGVNGEGQIQWLRFGAGLVHNGLIGGKPGSGKTNLLHLLLLGLMQAYAPKELELYLIDFKEGVEFKDYDTLDAPHVRVLGLESERELGVSVLRRLQQEMKLRADRFRPSGAHAIDEFRKRTGEKMPRVLLVIDEYQLLFVPDNDALAMTANQLLTDIVKRGRAFGIHVLLSSQSPASAFTNNRDALGQIALRISFQAEDAVARQILAADNDEARLLERPGEAIFNTDNGLPKKNIFVQVAYLPHAEQRTQLTAIAQYARRKAWQPAEPRKVFESDAPVFLTANREMREQLAHLWSSDTRTIARLWLGEAIELKLQTSATTALLDRRTHANVLIAGQDKKRALALLVNALFGLAIERVPNRAQFIVLDLTRPESPGELPLVKAASLLPHPKAVGDQALAVEALNQVITVLNARESGDTQEGSDIYFFIAGLTLFNALNERDKYDNPGAAAKDFIRLVTSGPERGIHVIGWTASFEQFDRMLKRPGTSQFGLRVALPMIPDESNRFLDKPAAAQLGSKNRALLRDDASGDDALEKFKPFELPTPSDLEQIAAAIRRNSPR